MTEIWLPRLHPGQKEVVKHTARFKILACGRRWGKTRLGIALCIKTALEGGRAWWVAPSYKLGAVGWRGIRLLAGQISGVQIRLVDKMAIFPSGGSAQIRSADDPRSLRSEGLDYAVLDECAYMKFAAWNESLRPALTDRQGGAMFISTPHGLNWFRDLWLRGQSEDYPEYKSWRFPTSSNPYIAAEELEAARAGMLYRIYRQEYDADFLEDNPSALWKREWIDDYRELKHPEFSRIAVGVDPSASSIGNECGIVGGGVARIGDSDHLYVLQDKSLQGTPDEWGRAAVALYHQLDADILIAEKNNGGEMVEHVIKSIDTGVRVKLVHASRGKHPRAEPISAIYEQGRGHHVGTFQQLEDQMCQWEPGNTSPDRMDALVWLATELIGRTTVKASDFDGLGSIEGYDSPWV